MQECEKKGGRKSLATVALILSKLLPPHTPHLIVTFTASHPHHLAHLSASQPHTYTMYLSHHHSTTSHPSHHHTITPSHHLPPCTPSHCTHAHELLTPLPQQVQDGVDRIELRHMPSGGIAARSLDRVPTPRTNGHHHQHAQRHGDHRARAWL